MIYFAIRISTRKPPSALGDKIKYSSTRDIIAIAGKTDTGPLVLIAGGIKANKGLGHFHVDQAGYLGRYHQSGTSRMQRRCAGRLT